MHFSGLLSDVKRVEKRERKRILKSWIKDRLFSNVQTIRIQIQLLTTNFTRYNRFQKSILAVPPPYLKLFVAVDFNLTKMQYKEVKPCRKLAPHIHSFWELKGEAADGQWERIFPDGCAGLVVNLRDTCLTDNGSLAMEFGKTYAVGAMTTFKDSFIDSDTHLMGICMKPGAFTNFYDFISQSELKDVTVELDKSSSFEIAKVLDKPIHYLNQYFTDRNKNKANRLHPLVNDIHSSNGQLSIHELAKRNYTTVKQLERDFKMLVGISPKEYSNIVRFQNALRIIQNPHEKRSFLDIAFECGYYDHSHLANEIKRNTGLCPSDL